jgi:hypothetical protein
MQLNILNKYDEEIRKDRRNSFFMTQLNKYYQVMPVKCTNVLGLLFLDLNFKK